MGKDFKPTSFLLLVHTLRKANTVTLRKNIINLSSIEGQISKPGKG